ncbi:MAG: nitrous oxide-stimulated promoter family protein [Dehalococcoidales bacterium]|jgi:hypothetical protein|nr:nitrous oxide-stimulated promoter family protein [Dehalococcoidales bacterium]MDD3264856.1 nitrous oxide-stimulated promoter family protein [Dehalococcoidales bacterium]MDD4322038.1 nitrous oxide-stimulated promoter family protein [Dehalococcoidales bacterium]MDD4794415.1 nitrous oxide-stimulated promoter family protein [Dehalococcoidales bacterium]MDD5122762.1 nitrous oxide-stimulated promoter family protein [Dehalococcoidales bacterium]
MSRLFDNLDDKKTADIKTLIEFINIYCREKHVDAEKKAIKVMDERLESAIDHADVTLCGDCERLLNHAIAKLMQCPFDPKPSCRKCPDHCYAPYYREQIKKVMRFSGTYLVSRGKVNLLFHLLK